MKMGRKQMKSIIVLLLIVSLLLPQASYVNVEAKETETEWEDERIIPNNPKRPASNTDYWSGDYVYFGRRGEESMKWKVLQNDGKNLLLLANRTLGTRAYHDVGELGNFNFSYESSTIRKWLNSDFIEETFTEEESEYLLENKVPNGFSQYSKLDSGPDTEDRVYLLSYKELKKAKYGFWLAGGKANSRLFYDEKDYSSSVWTRTLESEFNSYGDHYSYPWWVNNNGGLYGRGSFLSDPVTWDKGILPVIRIPISCPYWTNDPQDNEENDKAESPEPDATEEPDEIEWKLKGMDFEYLIPDDIPALGGGKVSIDMNKLPVEFSQDGNQFRIAIGVEMKTKSKEEGGKGLFDLKPEEWKSFKKWAEETTKKQRGDISKSVKNLKNCCKKGKIGVPMDKSLNMSMEAAGFCEGTIENGVPNAVGGGIYIKISIKGELEKQIFFHIPIVIKGEASVEASGEYSVHMDLEKAELYTSSEVALSLPKVKVSAGLGVTKIADISAYGSLDNQLKIQGTSHSSATQDENKISLTLFGEAGISVTALLWSYEKALFSIKGGEGWEYWNSINGFNPKKEMKTKSFLSSVTNKDLKMQKVEKSSKWYPKEQKMMSLRMTEVSKKSRLLQTGVYDKSEVKTAVSEDGTKMMVYVSEQPERTKGNHTAVSYSIWNEDENKWSEPKIIEDDGTADFYPDIKAVGNDIYVAWTDANRNDFSEDTEFDEMAQDCEISVAKYDSVHDTFTTTKLTNNSHFDFRPSLGTWQDGKVGVIWTRGQRDESTEDSLLNLSGRNEVVYALCNNGFWGNEIVASSFDDKVPSCVGLGQISDKDCIAFILEKKGTGNPSGGELYVAEAGKEAEKIELEDSVEERLQFVNLAGNNMLTWYSNQAIYYMNDFELKTVWGLAQNEKISSDYKIISDKATSILLFSNTTEESGTELYASVSKDNALFFAPIELTDEGGYINGFDGIVKEDNLQFVYGVDDVTIGEDVLEKTVSIHESFVSQYHDLRIASCTIDEEAINKSRKLSFDGIIANNGFYEEKNPKLKIACDGEEVFDGTVNNEAWIGQTMRFYGSIELPETLEIKKGSVITFTVLPAEGEDPALVNNVFEYTVDHTDLDLTVDDSNEENGTVDVTAVNQGLYDVEAVLNIYDVNKKGEIVKTVDLGTLTGGEKKTEEIEVEELLGEMSGRALYFELESGEQEYYESNNISINYLGKYIENPEKSALPAPTGMPDIDSTSVEGGSSNKQPSPSPATTQAPQGTGTVSAAPSPTKRPPVIVRSTPKPYTPPKIKVKAPGKVNLKKVKALGKQKVKVTWKWAVQDGYQLQYATNRAFTKNRKTLNKKWYPAAATVKNLKKGKTYYFRVRACNRALNGKKKYGKWSNVKKCRVK